MCNLPERSGQKNEKRWRHNQSVFVHGKIVVNAVEKEVECDSDAIVWEVANLC